MHETMIAAPRGWWDLADADNFYPSDLPEDWRLSYFTNAFRASVLPHAVWSNVDSETWAQWREDIPSPFRFIAEIGPSQHQAHRALEQTLGPQLSDWLDTGSTGLDGWVDNARDGTVTAPCWPAPAESMPMTDPAETDGAAAGHARTTRTHPQSPMPYAALAPGALHHDLRAARRWIDDLREQHGRPPSLIILAQPRSDRLEAWLQFLELLG
jgi:hypothetical protein